jgi:hypothetical protein
MSDRETTPDAVKPAQPAEPAQAGGVGTADVGATSGRDALELFKTPERPRIMSQDEVWIQQWATSDNPKEVRCMVVFDALWACLCKCSATSASVCPLSFNHQPLAAPRYQYKQIYRYGNVTDCRNFMNDFALCMKIRSNAYSRPERAQASHTSHGRYAAWQRRARP